MSRMESPEDNYERVSARLSGSRLEAFNQLVDDEGLSKSEVIRRGIDAVADSDPDSDETPLQPPAESRLEWAYERLAMAANSDGVVRDDSARRVCAGGPENLTKGEVPDLILRPLHRRGYLRRNANIFGSQSWQLVGWGE